MDRTISNDPKLCIGNAEVAARWMQENAKVCRIGRGVKRQFFFRLAGDPRDDIEDATLVKEIKVFGGLPFATNEVVKAPLSRTEKVIRQAEWDSQQQYG